MKAFTCKHYEVTIFLGARRGYEGAEFTEADLTQALIAFQKDYSKEDLIAVRVTPTLYVMKEYRERGWEISAVNSPADARLESDIDNFMFRLAEFLAQTFDQKRLNLAFPDRVITLDTSS